MTNYARARIVIGLFLTSVMLTLLGCSPDGLLLHILEPTDGSVKFEVLAFSNGHWLMPKEPEDFIVGNTILIHDGDYSRILVRSLDEDGCVSASAVFDYNLQHSVLRYNELDLRLQRQPFITCPLAILDNVGLCRTERTDSRCVEDPRNGAIYYEQAYQKGLVVHVDGSRVSVLRNASSADSVAYWNGDCTGFGECELLMDRRRKVSAHSGPRVCSSDNICQYGPLPTSVQWNAVASSAQELWAVGEMGAILHCKSDVCAVVPSTSTATLLAVSVSEDGTAWAVGTGGTILRCQAERCRVMGTEIRSKLKTVSAVSENEAWAGGENGILMYCNRLYCRKGPDSTAATINYIAIHVDKSVWYVDASMAVGYCNEIRCGQAVLPVRSTTELTGIVSDNDGIWISGFGGVIVYCKDPLSCRAVIINSSGNLTKLKTNGSDIIAASDTGKLIQCVDPAHCSTIEASSFPIIDIAFSDTMMALDSNGWILQCGVAGCSPFDETVSAVRAIAAHGSLLIGVGGLGALQQCSLGDKKCKSMTSPLNEKDQNVIITPSSEAWVAGGSGRVLRCESSGCSTVETDFSYLSWASISSSNDGSVWAAGSAGLIMRCINDRCHQVKFVGNTKLKLIKSGRFSDVWAIGSNGAIIHCDKAETCQSVLGATGYLNDIFVARSGVAYVVGDGGRVYRCKDSGCQSLLSNSSEDLLAVTGNDVGLIWVTGTGGAILRCENNPCLPYSVFGLSAPLSTATVDIAGNAWFVGPSGTIVHCDDRCEKVSIWAPVNIRSVAPDSSSGVWIVGDSGSMAHCLISSGCTQVSTKVSTRLRSVATDSKGDIWVSGDNGTILRKVAMSGF